MIFFAYIGFDAVSTGGEEANNPKRGLPIAIVGSLVIGTVIYILVFGGGGRRAEGQGARGVRGPAGQALDEGAGIGWGASLLAAGALVAITSVLLTSSTARRGSSERWPATG